MNRAWILRVYGNFTGDPKVRAKKKPRRAFQIQSVSGKKLLPSCCPISVTCFVPSSFEQISSLVSFLQNRSQTRIGINLLLQLFADCNLCAEIVHSDLYLALKGRESVHCHLFCSFDVSKIRNFSFSFQTFLSFFLSDSVAPEVWVRLVESDSVAHRVDSVVKLVDGFIQLLAVLILLPFVVPQLFDEVHTPRRDK